MSLTKSSKPFAARMSAQLPGWRAFALLITLAAAIVLLWHSDSKLPLALQDSELRGDREPDSFVVNGHYTSYDQQGDIRIRFISPRIEQFEAAGYATMAEPQATIQPYGQATSQGQPGVKPWQITAKRGKLREGNSQLELEGDVRIVRQIGERSAILRTARLTLDSHTNMAYTDAPVEIVDTIGTTRATGMKAWLNERILELGSQVKGHYETGN